MGQGELVKFELTPEFEPRAYLNNIRNINSKSNSLNQLLSTGITESLNGQKK